MKPLFQEITYIDPLLIFEKVTDQSWPIFLDSATSNTITEGTNRYSYVCFDPFDRFIWRKDQPSSLAIFQEKIDAFHLVPEKSLPPFQGGLSGYLSYDLCQEFENIPSSKDNMKFPLMMFGFYDAVISFDHLNKQAWIVSTGLPELSLVKRRERARGRIDEINNLLKVAEPVSQEIAGKVELDETQMQCSFSKEAYLDAVQVCRDYILEGDIFEVNLALYFSISHDNSCSYLSLYKKLREVSPAPFAAYLSLDDVVLLSSSPERFISISNNVIEARPIKGTIRRGATQQEDKQLADQLVKSEKDRSENIMIVDLMRNDFSKICEPDSVQVEKLCGLESYANVHHLVSVVTGKIRDKITVSDIIHATFPGGSITGAPKIRAMEIIAEIEKNERGPYCGSIGFIGFDGTIDFSIVIRTLCIKNNNITFQAGGAIVLDSDPKSEYQEMIDKLSGLKKALFK